MFIIIAGVFCRLLLQNVVPAAVRRRRADCVA